MPKIKHRESVLRAIRELEMLGRDRFLKRFGFGRSRNYFLIHNGKEYDSKAIAAVAFGYENPSLGPLKSPDFNGGHATVKGWLEQLGFEVIFRK